MRQQVTAGLVHLRPPTCGMDRVWHNTIQLCKHWALDNDTLLRAPAQLLSHDESDSTTDGLVPSLTELKLS